MDGPERDVGEDNDGRAIALAGQILPEPIELVLTEQTEAAGAKVHAIVEADEMHALVIEAAPAIAAADSTLAVTFHVCAAIVFRHVMFARHAVNGAGAECAM